MTRLPDPEVRKLVSSGDMDEISFGFRSPSEVRRRRTPLTRLREWLKPRPKPRGRLIYDELVDDIGAPPAFFGIPFNWPDGPDASVPEVLPSDVDDELIRLAKPEDWEALPDTEFWDALKRGV